MNHNLTTADLLAGYTRDEWAGHGYLGERQSALDTSDPDCPPRAAQVEAADGWIVAEANRRGWTADQLFYWTNSKHGRWFADAAFGGFGLDRAIREFNPEPASWEWVYA